MKKKIILFSILGLFVFAGCRKHETKVVHEDAPNNAQGFVYSVPSENWQYDGDGDTILYASFEIPELTDQIFDHGAVMVYLSFFDDMFETLPEVFGGVSYNALHYPGKIEVEIRDLNPHNPVYPPDGDAVVKIVLINAQAVSIHPNVDLTDYGEVKKVFNLQ